MGSQSPRLHFLSRRPFGPQRLHAFLCSLSHHKTPYICLPLPHRSPKALQHAVSSLYAQYMPLPLEPGSQPHLRFHHFVGYGGQYYSYLFARCIAEALWAKFFLNGPDRAGGEAVRELLLRPGGAVAPQALVRQLLGKGALREVEDGFAPSGELVAGFLRGALGEEALGGGGRPADGVVG